MYQESLFMSTIFQRSVTVVRATVAGLGLGLFMQVAVSAQKHSQSTAQISLPENVELPPDTPETIEQTLPRSPQTPPDPPPPIPEIDLDIPTPQDSTPGNDSLDLQFPIDHIEVLGNTVLQDEIAAIAAQIEGQLVTFNDLLQLRSDITQLYIDNGYITSGAFLPNNQDLSDRTVQIQVLEGTLESIEITGLERLQESYVRDRVQIGTRWPLNQQSLEDSLRLLQLDPLLESVNAELIAGSGSGQNVLRLDLVEADAFSAALSLDNYRSPSVGTWQGAVSLAHLNVLGWGDRAEAAYSLTEGLDLYSFSYTLPITPQGGTVSIGYDNSDSQIIEDIFRDLGIRSEAQTFSLGLRQPISRSASSEFALGLDLELRRSKTFLLDRPFSFSTGTEDGESNITAIRFYQDWTQRNTTSVLAARSQFSLGVNAFDATVNNSGTDGRFFSWLGQFQWVERASPSVVLVSQINAQLTPDSLLPIERSSLGGIGSVRGYETNQVVADNTLSASIEALVSLTDTPDELLLTSFIELGTAWNNQAPRLDRSTLAGFGLGIRWEVVPTLQLRADYGIPLIPAGSKSNLLQSNGFYFSLSYELN